MPELCVEVIGSWDLFHDLAPTGPFFFAVDNVTARFADGATAQADQEPPRCLRRIGVRCTDDVECGLGACEPVFRDRCINGVGEISNECTTNADCDDRERCEDRPAFECVDG